VSTARCHRNKLFSVASRYESEFDAGGRLTPASSSSLRRPPLTGRENAISFLIQRLEVASRGKGCLVLVSGEAGIGKSRLLEELSERAKAIGFRVLSGNCVPGVGAAYLPFQEIVEGYFGVNRKGKTSRSKRLLQAVKRSGPEIGGAVPVVGGVVKLTMTLFKEYHTSKSDRSSPDLERTFSAMLDFLHESSSHQPLLILLDDLQWADSASIQMLHFLARNSVALKVVLVGTYRPEELRRESAGRENPLLDSLRIMRREGLCEELSLDRLSADKTRLIIQAMLDGTISDDLVERIVEESGGNPLFIIETIRLLVETGAITLQDGRWEEKQRGETISIPSSVLEVIRRRLDEVPEETRRELSYAAVLGEVFEPLSLAEMLEVERIQVLEDLDGVERRFQLVRPFEGAYRFSHEKVRRVLYDEIPTELQKELHRRVGMILEQRLPDHSLHSELSLHFCKAKDEARCIKYSLLSAQDSLGKFANDEAVRYFDVVARATKDDPSFLNEHLVALEGLGDAQIHLGMEEKALKNYGECARLGKNPAEIVRVLRKSADFDFTSKRLAYLSQAEAYGDVDKLETGRLKIIRGQLAIASGDFDESERIYLEAQRLFDEAHAKEDLVTCLIWIQALTLRRGDIASVLENYDKYAELLESVDHPMIQRRITEARGDSYLQAGLVDRALKEANRCISISSKFGYEKAAINSRVLISDVYSLAGDFESADQEARKALELALKIEDKTWRVVPMQTYAHSCLHKGRIAQAEELTHEISTILSSFGIPTGLDELGLKERRYLDPWNLGNAAYFHSLRAELQGTQGNVAEGRREFQMALSLFHTSILGVWYEAYWRQHYAEYVLLPSSLESEAKLELEAALKLYDRLGNKTQAERTRKSLAQLT
jgi:tetratricopeptide (TPR) repeat protein